MLFDKYFNGTKDLKEQIGFLYADVEYDNLKIYLDLAKRDVLKIIGKPIYDLALAFYKSPIFDQNDETDQPDMFHLVKRIQMPIALLAYRKYAPGADLAHSDNGRQITVTDQVKPAFEWMIARDNANITALAYEAIDFLLEFLEEQLVPVVGPDFAGITPPAAVSTLGLAWAATPEFLNTKSLFINSAREFDKYFPINQSRQFYMTVVPFIREAEIRHLRPILLKAFYETIIERIKDGDSTAADLEIINLSRPSLAMLTMSVALTRLSMEVLPDGIFQNFTAGITKQSNTANSMDRRALALHFETEGLRLLKPVQLAVTMLAAELPIVEEITDPKQPYFIA